MLAIKLEWGRPLASDQHRSHLILSLSDTNSYAALGCPFLDRMRRSVGKDFMSWARGQPRSASAQP
jgi:hypothetical protein